jgi:GLPGLI family protein
MLRIIGSVFFIITSFCLIGQTCEVTFICKNRGTIADMLKENGDKMPQKQREVLSSMEKHIDNYHIQFLLIHEINNSSFTPKNEDTNVLKTTLNGGAFTYFLEEKDDKIYKYFANKRVLFNKNRHGRSFYIRDSFPDFCWNFTSEKKEILGYTCTKATIKNYHDQEIIAWYASEIPIPNGPIEFGGLPGLILELTISGLGYDAIEIKLNPKETTKIEKPKQKEKQIITMAEFFEKTKKVKSFGKKGN